MATVELDDPEHLIILRLVRRHRRLLEEAFSRSDLHVILIHLRLGPAIPDVLGTASVVIVHNGWSGVRVGCCVLSRWLGVRVVLGLWWRRSGVLDILRSIGVLRWGVSINRRSFRRLIDRCWVSVCLRVGNVAVYLLARSCVWRSDVGVFLLRVAAVVAWDRVVAVGIRRLTTALEVVDG